MKQLSFGAVAGFALALVLAPGLASAEVGYGGSGGSSSGGGSVGGGGFAGFPNPTCSAAFDAPAEGFKIQLNDGAKTTNNRLLRVTLDGGLATTMSLSNTPAFINAQVEMYARTASWMVPEGDGVKTVYVRFYNGCGVASTVVSASIELSTGTVVTKDDEDVKEDGQVLGEQVTLVDELIARLQYGRRDADVIKLQTELVRLGYMPRNWRATNFYGTVTLAGVNRYVDAHPLSVKEASALVRLGQTHPNVRRLQAALKKEGLMPRNWRVNNFFGTATRNALNDYNAR